MTEFRRYGTARNHRNLNDTSYLHNGLEQRGLTPRLQAMKIDEKGMVFFAKITSDFEVAGLPRDL